MIIHIKLIVSRLLHAIHNSMAIFALLFVSLYRTRYAIKGQIISECPYEIIVCPKIAMKKFPRFVP